MSSSKTPKKQPWASGPGEILQHGISLLEKDTDTSRRLAMLSIDNAVELMLKTYIGLPSRVTGFKISRKEYEEVSQSFPLLLDSLEKYCSDKLDGISLAELEWFHRLRNQLYHEGNGLTVEREKVSVYSALAQLLFLRLFGFQLELSSSHRDYTAEFINAWSRIERAVLSLSTALEAAHGDDHHPELEDALGFLEEEHHLPSDLAERIDKVRRLRNSIVHDAKPVKRDDFDEINRILGEILNIFTEHEMMMVP